MSGRALLLLGWIAASVPFCFFRPFYGILMWCIISFANPQSYAWGAGYEFNSGVLVALPTLAGSFIFSRGLLRRIMTREVGLLVILWLWFLITSVVADGTPLFAPHAADTWLKFNFITKVLLMTIITIGVVDSFERLRTLTIVIVCCFGLYVVKALPFMLLSGGTFRIYGAEHSMLEDNNDFGLALNMTLPMMFFLAQTETNRWAKRFFWFLFLGTIPAIFFTYSRGALLGLMAIMGLLLLRSKQRLFLIPVLVSATLIAVLFAPREWQERMRITSDSNMSLDKSAWSRINAWTFAWRLASDYPITGGGFKTFTNELFQRYAPVPEDVHGAHSVYFGVLAEHGFVGLFLYLTVVVFCFRAGAQVTKWAKYCGDEVSMNYSLMFQLSIIGFLTSGIFLGRAYFDYYYTLIACLAILKRLTYEKYSDFRAREDEEEEVAAAPGLPEGTVAV
jgi:probable O-glycosylation ligase (exosortase A-associated)